MLMEKVTGYELQEVAIELREWKEDSHQEVNVLLSSEY